MQPFYGSQMWQPSNYCNYLGLYSNSNLVLGNPWAASNGSNPLNFVFNFILQKRQQELFQMQSDMSNANANFGSYSFMNYSKYDPEEANYMSKSDPDRGEKLHGIWGDIAAKRGLNQRFFDKVVNIADRIGCYPEDLLGVMSGESGLNSKAVNPEGGATGLIQFMPKTARSLGTTTSELKNMSAVEQLDYVEKFYMNAKKSSRLRYARHLSGADLYAITFLPARADREVLTRRGENYYEANKGTDHDKDGDIDKKDLMYRVAQRGRWVT